MRSYATPCAALVGSAVLLVLAPSARALPSHLGCSNAIVKEARAFVARSAKVIRSCRDAELANPGACVAPDPIVVDHLAETLAKHVAKKCSREAAAELGFPASCLDRDPDDGFTTADLTTCIRESHQGAVEAAVGLSYDATLTGPVSFADRHCQEAVGRRGAEFMVAVLRAVQRCRTGILRGKIGGVTPERCAFDHAPTVKAMAKAERKIRHLVDGRCTDAQADRLRLCDPDQPFVNDALDCLIAKLRALVDDPDQLAPPDLIDVEYAARPAPVCGDGVRNAVGEECDGGDAAACAGACGASGGLFPCLCATTKRQRVVERANGDFDLWWSGSGHDGRVVEGSGYLTDLRDCDGATGPDTLCTVGPSCSLTPHSPCAPAPDQYVTGDTLCAGLGQGTCRTTAAGATGPHCLIDFQQRCATNQQCPGAGDRCVHTLHGPPMPLASSGVGVCLVNVLSEDVVGTTDLVTGAGAVRVRQRRLLYLGSGTVPCPVCGGFCEGAPGHLCGADGDCAQPPFRCVTDSVCSAGTNAGGACRPEIPFGGESGGLGTTSIDCRPSAGSDISAGGLDVVQNPRATTSVVLTAGVPCLDSAFAGNACVDGTDDGRPCTTAAECSGGDCRPQCFCTGQWRPNPCDAACVGGTNDAAPCTEVSECPGGFCHAGDCRVDPIDLDSCQEGRCTTGPGVHMCSISTFMGCETDTDCQAPACPACEPGETCVTADSPCFVSGRIERCGVPGLPDRTTAAVSCVPGTSEASVNGVLGAPGPAALTQPETTVTTGF